MCCLRSLLSVRGLGSYSGGGVDVLAGWEQRAQKAVYRSIENLIVEKAKDSGIELKAVKPDDTKQIKHILNNVPGKRKFIEQMPKKKAKKSGRQMK